MLHVSISSYSFYSFYISACFKRNNSTRATLQTIFRLCVPKKQEKTKMFCLFVIPHTLLWVIYSVVQGFRHRSFGSLEGPNGCLSLSFLTRFSQFCFMFTTIPLRMIGKVKKRSLWYCNFFAIFHHKNSASTMFTVQPYTFMFVWFKYSWKTISTEENIKFFHSDKKIGSHFLPLFHCNLFE